MSEVKLSTVVASESDKSDSYKKSNHEKNQRTGNKVKA